MARIRDVVFDCAHPASLARFWAEVLDDYEVAPYDDPEIARLRAMGIERVEDDPTVLVEAPGVEPRLFFQKVEETKKVKNRVHLDLQAANREAEAQRLVGLGASIVAVRDDWTTMSDPEGNEFCVSA
jgi:hypothetical protein